MIPALVMLSNLKVTRLSGVIPKTILGSMSQLPQSIVSEKKFRFQGVEHRSSSLTREPMSFRRPLRPYRAAWTYSATSL